MLAAFAYFSRSWCFCVRLKTIAYENIVQIFCSILRCCGYDSFFSSCSKDSVTVKIGSYSDNMTFALESVSATKAVLVDSEVESDGTSWKEEYVFKKLFWPEPWVARSELPRNGLETDPKQRCRKC